MRADDSNRILIAGAGIAGLTAALAFAQRGFAAHVFERSDRLEEIGAGLQVSPNATRILDQLGVLKSLRARAVRPDAVVMRRASTLAEIARVPLGDYGERRWGAPYLVARRADLQSALLDVARNNPRVTIETGATVQDFGLSQGASSLKVERGGTPADEAGALAIAADGVWSTIRAQAGQVGKSRYIGQLAWRRTLETGDGDFNAFVDRFTASVVTAFLHPGFHLIAYPISSGRAINLVAFTRSRIEPRAGWGALADSAPLAAAMRSTHPALTRLVEPGRPWTAWPIHVADLDGAWVDPAGLALIGDAAHAMTPFAAQGAAMAIEDADTLAEAVTAASPDVRPQALANWALARRRRVMRVARRGALNEFAWHARGPVVVARDLFLKARGGEKLAGDLDWLYGWRTD